MLATSLVVDTGNHLLGWDDLAHSENKVATQDKCVILGITYLAGGV